MFRSIRFLVLCLFLCKSVICLSVYSEVNGHVLSSQRQNPLFGDFLEKVKISLSQKDISVIEFGSGDKDSTILFDLIDQTKELASENILTIYVNDQEFGHLSSVMKECLKTYNDIIKIEGSLIFIGENIKLCFIHGDVNGIISLSEDIFDFIYIANVTHFFNPEEFLYFFEQAKKKLAENGFIFVVQRDIADLERSSVAYYSLAMKEWEEGDMWAGYNPNNISPLVVSEALARKLESKEDFARLKISPTAKYSYNDISPKFVECLSKALGFDVCLLKKFDLECRSGHSLLRLSFCLTKMGPGENLYLSMLKKLAKEKLEQLLIRESEIRNKSDEELLGLLRK